MWIWSVWNEFFSTRLISYVTQYLILHTFIDVGGGDGCFLCVHVCTRVCVCECVCVSGWMLGIYLSPQAPSYQSKEILKWTQLVICPVRFQEASGIQ